MAQVILLRTNRFGPREHDFVARLQAQSGHAVYALADETRGAIDTGTIPKIVLTRDRLRALGLRCPQDFGWRCGDYGFYLARQDLPDIRDFWLIEPDVRAAVADWADVFQTLDAIDADFLAPHVVPSEHEHFWHPTMRWLTAEVYRCSFAFCRISAAAADMCLAERVALSRSLPARLMWPNDETFVTTTLRRLGRTVRDFNEGGRPVCSAASFGFAVPYRGEAFDTMPRDGLVYHPVLWGEDYDRKVGHIANGIKFEENLRLKLLRALIRAQHAAGFAPGARL